ncbi:Patched domain-containing protein 3 [Branchiostoma belcheri]|nr:Patched domain-containing protein 3 [Branchiostoma belcheri]
MIAKWIDAASGRVFYNLGKAVTKWPAPFILLPLVASGLLGYFGLIGLVVDDQFAPDTAETFPTLLALKDVGFFGFGDAMTEVIIQSKDGGDTLFRDDVVEEVLRLHRELTTANTTSGETFSTLCIRDPFTTECVLSGVLQLMITAGSGSALRAMNLTYPYYNPNRADGDLGMYFGSELGGVEISKDSSAILSSKALHLTYNVQANLSQWIDTFRQTCSGFESENIKVNYIALTWMEDEVGTLPARVAPYIGVVVGTLILFSVVSCMTLDWVLTKPWLAVMGVLSVVLAIASSMGALLLGGQSFPALNASIPFLLLGIGVDDMFVLIAAWRKCDERLPVEERMGRAMSDAGVSISITSITDCLAFTAGITSVFPSVRSFCIYAAMGVAFDFLYQITFFAAFMSLTGRRERANRHCLTCRPVLPKSEAHDKSAAYRLCCAAGVSRQEGMFDNPSSEEFNKDPLLNRLLYNNLVPFILKPSSKVVIILLHAAYLGVAIWGCLQVRIGITNQRLVAEDSYVRGYYDAVDTHFQTYGRKVDIFISEPQEYWTLDVQQAVLDKLQAFDQSQYFHDTSETGGNMISPSERGRAMMTEARSIADCEPLRMKAYSYDFFQLDHLDAIPPSSIQTAGIAVAIMFVVCFLLIPHWAAPFLATLALASINVGLLGYMTLWGVNLDIISLVSIVICVGFSVDFFAHMNYAYVTSKAATPEEKITETMRAVGMPILQSSLSTILGISVLAFFPAYLFRTLFKTVFLVMVFGAAHGLVILPILLTSLRPCASADQKNCERGGAPPDVAEGHIMLNPARPRCGNGEENTAVYGSAYKQSHSPSLLLKSCFTPNGGTAHSRHENRLQNNNKGCAAKFKVAHAPANILDHLSAKWRCTNPSHSLTAHDFRVDCELCRHWGLSRRTGAKQNCTGGVEERRGRSRFFAGAKQNGAGAKQNGRGEEEGVSWG